MPGRGFPKTSWFELRYYGDAHKGVLSVHSTYGQALFRFESFIAHKNLTRLGRDKLIYGLIINHQGLGGHYAGICLFRQTAHMKLNRLLISPSQTAWATLLSEHRAFNFTRGVNQRGQ